MKHLMLILLLALAGTTLAAAQDATQPQPPESPTPPYYIFFGAVHHYKVTIESENGLVSVLDVPEGVFLSVQAWPDQNPTYPGSGAEEIMEKAPVVISLANAVVSVEVL